MLKKLFKEQIKKILITTGPKLHLKKIFKQKIPILNDITLKSFGNKNKNKIFYVIKRTPGAGLFSNLTFILNHLKIAEKYSFIPVVDMENFPTIYNEDNKISGTLNSWNYYFKSVSKYNLKEVYKSKNVIFTDDFFSKGMLTSYEISNKKEFKKIIEKYIFIKPDIQKEINFYKKKYFKNHDKILGVHFRGTTYKKARGHAFPIPKKIMKKNIDYLLKKFGYNKILVVSEEQKYLEYLKKYYKEKLIFINVFRELYKDAFLQYPRPNHRYKLGKEIIIETLLLSCCSGFTFIKTNVSSAAIAFSKKKQYLHPLFIGFNSSNKYVARWKWYYKKILPEWVGGFKL
jgi:hypothetical protein